MQEFDSGYYDPEFVHHMRQVEIELIESQTPQDERRLLTAEAIEELKRWAERRKATVNG